MPAVDICPRCHAELPQGTYGNAAFCPACGAPVLTHADPGKLAPRMSVFWLTLLGSLALTGILTLVLGWPVFILGAVLPFFWIKRER